MNIEQILFSFRGKGHIHNCDSFSRFEGGGWRMYCVADGMADKKVSMDASRYVTGPFAWNIGRLATELTEQDLQETQTVLEIVQKASQRSSRELYDDIFETDFSNVREGYSTMSLVLLRKLEDDMKMVWKLRIGDSPVQISCIKKEREMINTDSEILFKSSIAGYMVRCNTTKVKESEAQIVYHDARVRDRVEVLDADELALPYFENSVQVLDADARIEVLMSSDDRLSLTLQRRFIHEGGLGQFSYGVIDIAREVKVNYSGYASYSEFGWDDVTLVGVAWD